jgi:hypothetical protein
MSYLVPIIVVLLTFAAGYGFGFVRGLKRGGQWSLELAVSC